MSRDSCQLCPETSHCRGRQFVIRRVFVPSESEPRTNDPQDEAEAQAPLSAGHACSALFHRDSARTATMVR